jgi:hydroxylamine reductase
MKKDEHNKELSSKLVSKTMLISDVVEKYPDVIPILIQNGMHCIGCGASMFETLEEGFMGHGMNEKEVDKIMHEINEYVKKNSKK